MESSNSTQIKVGIFLSIGIVIILASIFMLGADRALFKTYVRIHAHFDQVQGLAEGSVVSLSGITVGNIEKITFETEHNTVDVTMKVDSDYVKKISDTSEVEIRTQGALGDKFVFIIPGDAKSAPIKDGDTLQVAKSTDIFSIISQRGQELGKVFDTIDEVYKLAKQINADNQVGKIVSNMSEASKNMNAASTEARKMMSAIGSSSNTAKIQSSIDKMNSILSKIDNGQGTLGALINDPSLHNKLKSILGVSSRKNNLKYLMRTSIEKDED